MLYMYDFVQITSDENRGFRVYGAGLRVGD